MDTSIYQEFITLVTHRNYASAARDLNMSQSSLSRHMAALSRELGCRLFCDTKPLTLTAAGEIVLRWSGKIVGDYENMRAELKSSPPAKDARIAIADMLSINTFYVGIMEATNLAKAEFPNFHTDYLDMQNSGLNPSEMVSQGRVDISFEVTLSTAPKTELDTPDGIQAIWIPEFHGNLVLGVAKDSPFADGKAHSLTDFAQSRFILQANRYSERFRKDFVTICAEVGFYPNITLVPSNNSLEFYTTPPRDGVHLLSRVDKNNKPIIADGLKKSTHIVYLNDRDRYVDAFVLAKDNPEQPELAFMLNYLKRHSEENRNRMLSSSETNSE